MSVPKNEHGDYLWSTVDPDTFLDFLAIYHEGKWEEKQWECFDVYLSLHGLSSRPHLKIDLLQCDQSSDDKNTFRKYLTYQWHQLMRGKYEIRCAYLMYLEKVTKKNKTRNISTQTDVSLDKFKKYYGPKVL